MTEKELHALLNSMSLDEKIGQTVQLQGSAFMKGTEDTGPLLAMGLDPDMIGKAGSVLSLSTSELIKKVQKNYIKKQPHNIPMLFMLDVIHGFRTVYPAPIGMGCTFDPEIMEQCAAMAAEEASAAGVHVTFSPMVDTVRDPRWGRVVESTGEDKYLNSVMGAAQVRGYQGKNIADKGKLAACVKHFAAYGAPEGGRDYNNCEISERTLMEDYMPAYKACVDAGVEMIMTSFNTLNRIPMTANLKIQRTILREKWGFKGASISDWGAIAEIAVHGAAEDHCEAAEKALKAGVDIDMCTDCYANYLKELIENGEIEESLLDEAVMRILNLKNKLGLFENPYKDADEEAEMALCLSEKHRAISEKAAEKSIVLLENDGILPLDTKADIAHIGPFFDMPHLHSLWALFADWTKAVSCKIALENDEDILLKKWAKGTELYTEKNIDKAQKAEWLKEAVEVARSAKTVVLYLGDPNNRTGEGHSSSHISLHKEQIELLEKVYEVNKNIVSVIFGGRPLDIREVKGKSRALVYAWLPGMDGGTAVENILFGKAEPEGRLSMSLPYNVGQIPVYYAQFNTGRPRLEDTVYSSKYLDIPNTPLYPFGYGLSYTSFEYSDIKLSMPCFKKDDIITAEVTVKNTGKRRGTETVQLYIRDISASVVRPLKELKGFKKVTLEPGESKTVSFEINEEMLRFYDIDMNYKSEKGLFKAYISHSSADNNCVEFKLL